MAAQVRAYELFHWKVIHTNVNMLALLVLVGTDFMAESTFRSGLRNSMMALIPLMFLIRIGAGFNRRRPYWTAQSWKRYFAVSWVGPVALASGLGIAYAIDLKLPIVGGSQSAIRGLWLLGSITLGLIGIVGFGLSLSWLANGEPSEQFRVPRWLGGPKEQSASRHVA